MTINCTSNSKYVNMSLLVNETLQHPNVIQLFNVNGTASYVFVPSKTYHNGTTFSCSGVVGDESILSSVVTISVLCKPERERELLHVLAIIITLFIGVPFQ